MEKHIPPEIVEEILLNLPVESLLRFATVSNSWNSSISGSGFIRNHKNRAALHQGKVVINSDYENSDSFLAISAMLPNHPVVDAKDFDRQFRELGIPFLHAFCDELWCVGVETSLFLWNPSIRNFKKIPDPLFPLGINIDRFIKRRFIKWRFVYGLGYDSVGDDYIIMKVPTNIYYCKSIELYSLRRDSWRKIHSFPDTFSFSRERCVFAAGKFYWLGLTDTFSQTIVSFDLSTDKYGAVVQPEYSPPLDYDDDSLEMTALRGMLCACVIYRNASRFVMWLMMEDSWSNKFDIHYSNWISSLSSSEYTAESDVTLRPLCLDDNDGILIKVCTDNCFIEIFMYKNEEEIPTKVAGCDRRCDTSDAFLYVETLVSPIL